MQKSEAIKNHKIKPNESGYYHLMFTKILKDGKRTRDEFQVQIFSKRELDVFQRFTDKNGLNATGFDEYEIIHTPGKSSELDELKKYLTESGVKFHPKTGIEKLRLLKDELNT